MLFAQRFVADKNKIDAGYLGDHVFQFELFYDLKRGEFQRILEKAGLPFRTFRHGCDFQYLGLFIFKLRRIIDDQLFEF